MGMRQVMCFVPQSTALQTLLQVANPTVNLGTEHTTPLFNVCPPGQVVGTKRRVRNLGAFVWKLTQDLLPTIYPRVSHPARPNRG